MRAWECLASATGEDLAEAVRKHHLPDFSHWKNHAAFEAAFARLDKDLRTSLGKLIGMAFVPQGQPEISQTRSVWKRPQKNPPVLKGRRNFRPFRRAAGTNSFCPPPPATSWLANFHPSLRDIQLMDMNACYCTDPAIRSSSPPRAIPP